VATSSKLGHIGPSTAIALPCRAEESPTLRRICEGREPGRSFEVEDGIWAGREEAGAENGRAQQRAFASRHLPDDQE